MVVETGVPGENHRPVASQWQALSNNVVSSASRYEWGLKLTTLVVIGTHYTCSYKSNYHDVIFKDEDMNIGQKSFEHVFYNTII